MQHDNPSAISRARQVVEEMEKIIREASELLAGDPRKQALTSRLEDLNVLYEGYINQSTGETKP